MKTSEFKEWCESDGYNVSNNDDEITVAKFSRKLITIEKDDVLRITTSYHGADMSCHEDLFNKAVEYAKTPIEEREEEKKFYLIAYWLTGDHENTRYLNVSETEAGEMKIGFSTKEQFLRFKTEFTEKEIEELGKRKVPVDSMRKIEVE